MRFLCWLGIHKLKYDEHYVTMADCHCLWCKKKFTDTFYGLFEQDNAAPQAPAVTGKAQPGQPAVAAPIQYQPCGWEGCPQCNEGKPRWF